MSFLGRRIVLGLAINIFRYKFGLPCVEKPLLKDRILAVISSSRVFGFLASGINKNMTSHIQIEITFAIPDWSAKLDQILCLLNQLICRTKNMSAELDALTAEVAAVAEVEASAIVLIKGLVAQITAAGTDPAKLAALTASLTASADALAAAVTANTPVYP